MKWIMDQIMRCNPALQILRKLPSSIFFGAVYHAVCKLILTTERENKILRVTMKKG